MRKRNEIKEIVMRSEIVIDEGITYTYTLCVRESDRVASYRIPLYSVTVKMVEGDGVETYAEARDAFSDVGKALVFYERIIEHLATPLNLPYVLEDELCT